VRLESEGQLISKLRGLSETRDDTLFITFSIPSGQSMFMFGCPLCNLTC
jgi:hypothetical protein